MTEKNRTSRIAGLLYLGVVLTGIFSLMYVPSKLINYDNCRFDISKYKIL